MKREKKNIQTRSKIVQSAILEFSKHGYEAASINSICQLGGISKGIIYHYFRSKDELYLYCLELCFEKLREFLQEELKKNNRNASIGRLSAYFDARINFFRKNSNFTGIFTEAIIFPPSHLKNEIALKKNRFDEFNRKYFREILDTEDLRNDIKIEEATDYLRLFQDFLNVRFSHSERTGIDIEIYESTCKNILEIFLYGIIRREDSRNVE